MKSTTFLALAATCIIGLTTAAPVAWEDAPVIQARWESDAPVDKRWEDGKRWEDKRWESDAPREKKWEDKRWESDAPAKL